MRAEVIAPRSALKPRSHRRLKRHRPRHVLVLAACVHAASAPDGAVPGYARTASHSAEHTVRAPGGSDDGAGLCRGGER